MSIEDRYALKLLTEKLKVWEKQKKGQVPSGMLANALLLQMVVESD